MVLVEVANEKKKRWIKSKIYENVFKKDVTLCFFFLVGRHIDSECNIYAKKNLFRISTAELLIVKFPTAVFFPYIIFFAPNKKTKEKEKLNSVLSECRSWTVIAKSIKGIPSWGCVVRFFLPMNDICVCVFFYRWTKCENFPSWKGVQPASSIFIPMIWRRNAPERRWRGKNKSVCVFFYSLHWDVYSVVTRAKWYHLCDTHSHTSSCT